MVSVTKYCVKLAPVYFSFCAHPQPIFFPGLHYLILQNALFSLTVVTHLCSGLTCSTHWSHMALKWNIWCDPGKDMQLPECAQNEQKIKQDSWALGTCTADTPGWIAACSCVSAQWMSMQLSSNAELSLWDAPSGYIWVRCQDSEHLQM